MVTIEIVVNFTRVMGVRVTISCRYCIAFKMMLLFLFVTRTALEYYNM